LGDLDKDKAVKEANAQQEEENEKQKELVKTIEGSL
jgi:hypothetical protein